MKSESVSVWCVMASPFVGALLGLLVGCGCENYPTSESLHAHQWGKWTPCFTNKLETAWQRRQCTNCGWLVEARIE